MDMYLILRKIREEKGIELEDIAREYRIQIKYLQAIEQGQFQELPAGYDQLFFRSYLKALQVNEDEYVEQFLMEREKADTPKPTGVMESKAQPAIKWNTLINIQSQIKSKNLFVLLPFVVILIILIVLLSTTRSIQTETPTPVKEIDVQSIAASLQPPVPADTVDSVKTAQKNLNLLINGLRSTWFRIITDKQDTAEYMLKRGNQMSVKASTTFEFVIGRADGLQFSLNEKPPQRVSTDSLVVSYLLIDSSGIVAKRFKQPKPIQLADSSAIDTNKIQ